MRNKTVWALLLALMIMTAAVAGLAEPPKATEGIVIPVIENMSTYTVPDNEAMALMRNMKCGWNLGNTFDAFAGYDRFSPGTNMETSWVGVRTTRELIAAVHEAGFNTIRMPVSWHNHVDENDVIDPEWMSRVRQVADWALNEGMYVIVNVHHDNDVKYFYPDPVHMKRSRAYLTTVWNQMAEAFKDCDEHLILESMNEPRLVGTQYEWNWNSSVSECRLAAAYINELNQIFVDTVRATGGNNATRYLAVPAYAGSPWNAVDQLFRLPEDAADNRIIVEAHAYTPYNFALNINSPDTTFDLEKDQGKKSEITSFLNNLYNRFVRNGIPVMMDEFGALDKGGNMQDRVNFTAFYVATATARNIPCVWWDNHNFTGGGERFGIIRRDTLEWACPDIALAIQEYCLKDR